MPQTSYDNGKMRRALCEVLTTLVKGSVKKWDEIQGDSDSKVINKNGLRLYWELIKKGRTETDDVERLIWKTEMHVELDRPVFLPPVESRFLPVLSMSCHMDGTLPVARIGLGLIESLDISTTNTQGLGFRFEAAHATGPHTYDHVQFTCAPFDRKKLEYLNRALKRLDWLPVSWPAFVLPSDNPVSLLLGLVVSLYGKEALKQFPNRIRATYGAFLDNLIR